MSQFSYAWPCVRVPTEAPGAVVEVIVPAEGSRGRLGMMADKFTIRTSTGLLFGSFDSREDAWAVVERVRKGGHGVTVTGAAVVPLLAGVTPMPLHPGWLMLLAPVYREVERLTQRNPVLDEPQRPRVVVLCGSTRFGEAFRMANLQETLLGRIVLSIGCDMRSDVELFAHLAEAEISHIKAGLDELHKRKIDLADEVLVLNVRGYVGDSTRSEIEYARQLGEPIRWLEPPDAAPAFVEILQAPSDISGGD